jgi:glycosyltransferase involved in cell wall biosynthesis
VIDGRARHIVIDGRELAGRPTGVGRYLMGILERWAAAPTTAHRFTVVVPGGVPPELAKLAPVIAAHQVAAGQTGTWFEQFSLPDIVRGLGADVFLAPAYTAPLRVPCPFVVAIHDLSYFAHPRWYGWREGARRRWLTKASARRASKITTLSEFSAGEITRYLGISRSRIEIVPPGSPTAMSETAGRREPLVLYAGTLLARRRIEETIAAFALVEKTVHGARLVLVGDDRSKPPIDPIAIARRAGVADRVEWRRYVPERELADLYNRARAFVFISDYEGFALTPMEALAHGVPVVLEDTPVAREVYADGASLVAPAPEAIAAALLPLLTDDDASRRSAADRRRRPPGNLVGPDAHPVGRMDSVTPSVGRALDAAAGAAPRGRVDLGRAPRRLGQRRLPPGPA